jgi:hypothetical protein
MTRSIFYGFGAWVGQVSGHTKCAWWAEDPVTLGFAPAKLIKSDLGMNPQAVRTGAIQIGAIEVDDGPAHGGSTRLGPTFPTGSMINSLWIESSRYSALADKPARPPSYMQCRDYELTSVLYWTDAMKGRRFYGFYAEITSEQSQNALCSIWPAGKSLAPGQPPAGSWWINLQTSAHPIEPGFTEIGIGPNDKKKGALFLDVPTIGNLQLTPPKQPPSQGTGSYPRMR